MFRLACLFDTLICALLPTAASRRPRFAFKLPAGCCHYMLLHVYGRFFFCRDGVTMPDVHVFSRRSDNDSVGPLAIRQSSAAKARLPRGDRPVPAGPAVPERSGEA